MISIFGEIETQEPDPDRTTSELDEPGDRDELEAELGAEALRFLVDGVVHKMNNVLAVFSSLTQMFEIKGPGWSPIRQKKDVVPLLDSVEAGRDVIGLLTELSPLRQGRPGREVLETQSICAGPFLQSIARTLLCEASGLRYPIVTRSDPQVYVRLAKSQLACLVLLMIRHVLGEASSSFAGCIEIGARQRRRGPVVELRFCLPADHLPFSLAPKPIDARIRRYAALLGVEIDALDGESGYRMRLPG